VLYLFSTLEATKRIIKVVRSIQRNFLWKGSKCSKKCPWWPRIPYVYQSLREDSIAGIQIFSTKLWGKKCGGDGYRIKGNYGIDYGRINMQRK
jgi:hypothetical protein